MHFRFRALSVAALAAAAVATTAGHAVAAPTATSIDRAFVREMIPHHTMAVEMARMATEQAEHRQIKHLAAAIVTDQSKEIRTLKRIARRLHVTPARADDHMQMMHDAHVLGLSMESMGMPMDMSELDGAKPFDRTFIDMMITHHRGAIRMARVERKEGRDAQLRRIARSIVAAQADEIRRMTTWRKQWYGATSPSGDVPGR